MQNRPTPLKPSRVTVPQRAHPAAKIVFAEMRRLGITYDELEFRSGVLKSTFKAWRTHNAPGLDTIQAALGSLGWEFLPVPRLEHLPEAVRALLAQAAEAWGSEDDLLCELIREVANRPLNTVGAMRGRPSTFRKPPTPVAANDEATEAAA